MTKVRKRHNAEFKSKVAIEAIKEQKTINELTAEYGVHATQISNWKKQALAVIPSAFNTKQHDNEQAQQATIDELLLTAKREEAEVQSIMLRAKRIVETPA